MAQHDYDIANQSGSSFRADLNNALDAIVSNNSGSSEPSTKFAYEWWIDTSNNLLKLRNSANNAWITIPISITADNSTPGALTVNGNLTTTGSVDIDGQELILDADADTSITADTDDQIDFRIGAVDVLTLTNSHLLLKGTTPKITIGDGGEEDTALIFDGNAQDYYLGIDDTDDVFKIGIGSTIGTTRAIAIDSDGDVGFGADTGDVRNDANASRTYVSIIGAANRGVLNIGSTASNGADGGKITFVNGTNMIAELSSDTTSGSQTAGILTLATSNVERMRVADDGKVGVNTSSPTVKFEVQEAVASAYTARFMHTGNPNSGPPQIMKLEFHNTPNNGTSEFLKCRDTLSGSAVNRAVIMSNGGIGNFTANDFNYSDQRMKKNIDNANNQLENIKSLSIKTFHYNEDADSDPKKLGVIAQEIQTNLPDLITEQGEGEEARLGVKEQQFMWMAIKAIQELEARVKTLEE